MKTKPRVQAIKELQQCSTEVILMAAAICDGHTILTPKAFLDAGLPQTVVDYQTRKHQSDGSPKGTLFVQGEPVKELEGVYGLDLLRFLADALGVEYRSALRRGSEARNIQSALRARFQRAGDRPEPS